MRHRRLVLDVKKGNPQAFEAKERLEGCLIRIMHQRDALMKSEMHDAAQKMLKACRRLDLGREKETTGADVALQFLPKRRLLCDGWDSDQVACGHNTQVTEETWGHERRGIKRESCVASTRQIRVVQFLNFVFSTQLTTKFDKTETVRPWKRAGERLE